MLFVNNKKTNQYLTIEINNSKKIKTLTFNAEEVLIKDTPELVKNIKIEVSKEFNLDRRDYFKFINHLSGSINDYRKYLQNDK